MSDVSELNTFGDTWNVLSVKLKYINLSINCLYFNLISNIN